MNGNFSFAENDIPRTVIANHRFGCSAILFTQRVFTAVTARHSALL
jgi:hypothetical protein